LTPHLTPYPCFSTLLPLAAKFFWMFGEEAGSQLRFFTKHPEKTDKQSSTARFPVQLLRSPAVCKDY
jgi:hypothetical protein